MWGGGVSVCVCGCMCVGGCGCVGACGVGGCVQVPDCVLLVVICLTCCGTTLAKALTVVQTATTPLPSLVTLRQPVSFPTHIQQVQWVDETTLVLGEARQTFRMVCM